MDPAALTAVEARRLLAAGELSARELVDACRARVDRFDPAVNAMVTRADERARAEAADADDLAARGASNGPLHGLPVAVKDLQPTAGIVTTFGSADFAEHVPAADAGIVARVRAAGGIVVGKTNIPEFSIGANTVNRLFGATGNPFDVDLTCGGSSGGSGVAVATGMAPVATGSDHGGSLRIPACFSGVVGFRATPGVVPFELRSIPQTNYSVQGPMARTVADAALLLSVIAGRDHGGHRDPMAFPLDAPALAGLTTIEPAAVRIGVSEDLGGVLVSESVRRTFRDRIDRLAAVVGRCEPLPVDLRQAPDVDWRLRQDVFVAQYADRADGWDDGFNPNIRRTYTSALATPMEDIARARRTQMELCRHVDELLDDVDVLVCPGVSVPPFPWRQLNPETIDGRPVENYMAWLALTASITVVGLPTVALPCGRDEQGTPFGLQIVGRRYQDRQVLSVAAALEAVLADDPVTARPVPDGAYLESAAATSTCRTAGRAVH